MNETVEFKFKVDTAALAGCLRAASDKDVRYYLNGVFLEFDTRTAVATTGYYLLAVAEAIAPVEAEPFPAGSVILPREQVAALVKASRKDASVELALAGNIITHVVNGVTTTFTVIDGKYPYWRRIVPKKCSLEAAQFDPQLLALLQDAIGAAYHGPGHKRGAGCPVTLHTNGKDSAGVMTCGNIRILGIVMPWLAETPDAQPEALDVAHPKPAAPAQQEPDASPEATAAA
jgi:DNA polymerase III subunit beta